MAVVVVDVLAAVVAVVVGLPGANRAGSLVPRPWYIYSLD
jgi:hypothetical protein